MGTLLSKIRKTKGLTIMQAAKGLGISEKDYLKLENGQKKISRLRWQLIAHFFKEDIGSVIAEEQVLETKKGFSC